jgi:exonuclease III
MDPTQKSPRNRCHRYKPTTIKIATQNIQDARQTRLEHACMDLHHQNIDVAILTEMRIPESKPIHTRLSSGYQVFAIYMTIRNQGGIALVNQDTAEN